MAFKLDTCEDCAGFCKGRWCRRCLARRSPKKRVRGKGRRANPRPQAPYVATEAETRAVERKLERLRALRRWGRRLTLTPEEIWSGAASRCDGAEYAVFGRLGAESR